MINKIIDGITIAINAEFGDDYEIYTENIEQGLQEPCFSVLCLNPTNSLFLGNNKMKRYFRTNQFCVHYFPGSDSKLGECYAAIDRLFKCLESITVDGDLVNGTNMNGQVEDGVLSFFVNYNMFMISKNDEDNFMTEVSQDTMVKG